MAKIINDINIKASKRMTVFIHYPMTKDEEIHLNKLYNLFLKKEKGDFMLVAKILNKDLNIISRDIERPAREGHMRAVEVLENIILNREKLINNINDEH